MKKLYFIHTPTGRLRVNGQTVFFSSAKVVRAHPLYREAKQRWNKPTIRSVKVLADVEPLA